ncbi:FeoB-associated Cys-rich membrane protein [Pseudodesulfovibrio thermohalotolerans]|uniref:FeoB-associated Cys-rich membrane protein n=1 Tax=Pseudodesulfovibrio thermohalotolerans TaxID=2880651 RepID=UPI0022B9E962|nr:FeoB-associated Cys-rich membrane protein [Pseudodesulfovibrio thermohalotolerans]WFS61623.1 FeoB-associated Cys-rich membrane protein [Pseudodesulfovibrio thermohalotolerans]
MDTVIAVVIIAAAVLFVLVKVRKQIKAKGGCGCGCPGDCAAKRDAGSSCGNDARRSLDQ